MKNLAHEHDISLHLPGSLKSVYNFCGVTVFVFDLFLNICCLGCSVKMFKFHFLSIFCSYIKIQLNFVQHLVSSGLAKLTYSNSCLQILFAFSTHTIMPLAINKQYKFSFVIIMPFIPTSCFIALIRISSTMLSRKYALISSSSALILAFCYVQSCQLI